jgi:hypothetical protein
LARALAWHARGPGFESPYLHHLFNGFFIFVGRFTSWLYTGLTMSHNDAVLLEDIDHKLDALLEGQTLLAPMSRKLDNVDERLTRLEADVKVIKKVVTDESRVTRRHTKRLNNQETRITNLEGEGLEYA